MQCLSSKKKQGHVEVYGARHRKTGMLVCVKKIYKCEYQSKNKIYSELEANRIRALQAIDHPHLIHVLQLLETEQYLYIVTEFVTGGDIIDCMEQHNGFTDQQMAFVTKQILSAVNYLHKEGICHRDLKPQNILVEEVTAEGPIIRLCDFS